MPIMLLNGKYQNVTNSCPSCGRYSPKGNFVEDLVKNGGIVHYPVTQDNLLLNKELEKVVRVEYIVRNGQEIVTIT